MRALLIPLILGLGAATAAPAQDFTTLKGHGGPIMGIDVAPDGRVATASFDNSVGLWRGRDPVWLEAHEAAVNDVVFGQGVLVSGGDDFVVYRWNELHPAELGRHKGKVTDVEISPDGALVASASWDGTIGLWDSSAGWRVLELERGGVNDIAFAADGKRLFAATSSGELLDVDPQDGTLRTLVKHGFGINQIAPGPDGAWIAYGAVDGVTRVVNAETGDQIADFSLDRRPILSIAHHAATGQLAVGDGHGYIMVIDTADWQITRDFRATRRGPVWALAYAPDGQVIYAGGLDDVAYAWPVELLGEFDPAIGTEHSYLRSAATMPNGERQFMRKCSICHALTPGASRKAGPTLNGLFGRPAGTVPGYRYSPILTGSDIIWSDTTIDALFDLGPDHYIPGSKMPMQRIAARQDRLDLIEFLKDATGNGETTK